MSRYNIFNNAGEGISHAIHIEATGNHTGSTGPTTLRDKSRRREGFPFNEDMVGKIAYNLTDRSYGYITAVVNGYEVTTDSLTGGTLDTWTAGDRYIIGEPAMENIDISQLRVIDEEEITVATAGTAVNPSSNVRAKAVRVINNNVVAIAVAGGSNIDATTSPKKGVPLFEADSRVIPVKRNANEAYIDADTNSTKVWVEILGI